VSYGILVIVVIFLMTILMIKFTSNVMDDWALDDIHSNYWNKVWYIVHPNIFVIIYYHAWLKVGWIITSSKWQYLRTLSIVNARMFIQGMTINVRFTFSVGDATWAGYNVFICWARQNRIGDTIYIFSVHHKGWCII
jgi:hypothetical protein